MCASSAATSASTAARSGSSSAASRLVRVTSSIWSSCSSIERPRSRRSISWSACPCSGGSPGPDALPASPEGKDHPEQDESPAARPKTPGKESGLLARPRDLEGRDLAGQQVQDVGGDEGQAPAAISSIAPIAVGRHERGVGSCISNWTSTSPASAALISRMRWSAARTLAGPRAAPAGRWTTGATASSRDPAAHLDRGTVALGTFPGLVAFRSEALGEPGLLEHRRSACRELGLGGGSSSRGLGEASRSARAARAPASPLRCAAARSRIGLRRPSAGRGSCRPSR